MSKFTSWLSYARVSIYIWIHRVKIKSMYCKQCGKESGSLILKICPTCLEESKMENMKIKKVDKNAKFKSDSVSAVIGVILMVMISVSVAGVTYAYVSGFTNFEQSHDAVPKLQFVKSGSDLVVSQSSENLNWSDVSVTSGTKPVFIPGTPNLIDAGETITGCVGRTTAMFNGHIVGTFNFPL